MENPFREGRLGTRMFNALGIKSGVMIILGIVIALYMIAYTISTPTVVISNGTGLWKGCPSGTTCAGVAGGNGITGVNPSIFTLSSIVVPIVILVAIILFFVYRES